MELLIPALIVFWFLLVGVMLFLRPAPSPLRQRAIVQSQPRSPRPRLRPADRPGGRGHYPRTPPVW